MAATKAASSKKGGAAARAERNGKGHSVDFRGLELTLPPKLPGTLAWDIAALDDEGANPMRGVLDILNTVFGDDQLKAIKEKVASEDIALDELEDVLTELVSDVFSRYGMTAGESPASAKS